MSGVIGMRVSRTYITNELCSTSHGDTCFPGYYVPRHRCADLQRTARWLYS